LSFDDVIGHGCAEGGVKDALAAIDGLASVGDGAAGDKARDPVAHEFRVHAKILPVFQLACDDIRHATDAELDASSVVDHRQDLRGDLPVDIGRRFALAERDVASVLDDRRNLRNVHDARPMGARHIRIDFDNDSFRSVNASERVGSAGAEAEPPAPVHWRDLQQENVEGGALADNAWNFAERVRHEMDHLTASVVKLPD
jgi:hypothetical protein